jgi:membrane associated rhomboid family serine protease
MIIIPVVGNISWKNPPYATILLILINCFVFLMFQIDEGSRMMTVYSHYFNSGLSDIEIPRYISFLENKEGASDLTTEYHALEEKKEVDVSDPKASEAYNSRSFLEMRLLVTLENDSDFMKSLYGGGIISVNENEYGRWKTLRAEFDKQKDSLMSYKFGLTPARLKPYTLLTCMFLHGGLGHLIGNMIFLWIVGCMLEMGCGRLVYGVGYVLVGLCASLFFFLIHSDSFVPMIGASGAISGLMGAMTVLYGLSRIKVFFSTGFYFDSFRIPAIILLPFWVGTEFFQFYFSGNGQVAYMAHAGGLMGGALLGGVARRFFTQHQKSYFEEKPKDTSAVLLEEALARIGRIDYAGARPMLMEYLALRPDHIEALEHLFALDKHQPGDLLKTAPRLLSAMIAQRMDTHKIWKTYCEYEKVAQAAALPVELQMRLAFLFCDGDYLEEAEKLIGLLLQAKPVAPNISTLLLRLIKVLDQSGASAKARQYRGILLEKFPMSPEARLSG